MRLLLLSFLLLVIVACGGGGGGETTTTPPDTGGGVDGSNVPSLPSRPAEVAEHWWNQSVFYEVFVRSYADSSAGALAGDGIGDFTGLIERLDYLNDGNPNTSDDLGVTAIWLMPIAESPSYHGYDVTDYRKVEPDYGSNADFLAFKQAANARGIKVIVDMVFNHASAQHPFFEASKDRNSNYRDWFVWRDQNPGFTGPWGQQVWHNAVNQYYYGLFWGGMPDWNYANPEVTAHMHEVSRYWLEDMQVDGFRLDAVRYLYEEGSQVEDLPATHTWLADFRNYYKAVNPEAMTVGEVWADSETVLSYKGEMDMTFQFDLATAILSAAQTGNTFQLQSELRSIYTTFEPGQFATFLTNHDQDRVMNVLSNDVSRVKLAASFLLTLPGVPFVYYGEEIGMTGAKPDELIRTPLQWDGSPNAGFTAGSPWIEVNADFPEKNIAAQIANDDSLWRHYQRLIEARNTLPAMAQGNYTQVEASSGVFAFLRQTTQQDVLVLINPTADVKDNYVVAIDADYDNAQEWLHGDSLQKGNPLQVEGLTGYKPLSSLAARSTYILVLP